MKEEMGNLWEFAGDARCITTNGSIKKDKHGVMGRGVARQAKQYYPGVDELLGAHLEANGNHTGVLVEGNRQTMTLVALPVKRTWDAKAEVVLIKRSLDELIALADARGWKTVILPRPGCGNGRLSWEWVVKPLVESRLDDRFVVVYAGTGRQWDA